ncbi:MAG: helix-turn-helix domain-containing protein [Bacteroidota bacterium]
MNASSVFHLIITFGALQALFLASILLLQKSGLTKRLFATFLFIEGFTLVERLLAETGLMEHLPHVLGLSYPLNFIKSPILYFTALSLIDRNWRLRSRHALHAIPFFGMVALNLPFYALAGPVKVEQVHAFIRYVPTYADFNFWFFLSFFAYIGVYLLISIQRLRKYQTSIKNNRPANWYLSVLILYTALLGLSLIHFLLRPSGVVEFPWVNEASMLLMTFLIQSIAYGFLSQSAVFTERKIPFATDWDQLTKDTELIRHKLEVEHVFTDDKLTLDRFSELTGLPKKYLSDVINQKFGVSFKQLVNRYRVEQVKRQMPDKEGATLTSLGLQAGFNNKVTFYRTFKQHTGKSPSEYLEGLR